MDEYEWPTRVRLAAQAVFFGYLVGVLIGFVVGLLVEAGNK